MQKLSSKWDYVYTRSEKEKIYKYFVGPVDSNGFIDVILRIDYESLAQLMCMFPDMYKIVKFVADEKLSEIHDIANALLYRLNNLAEGLNDGRKN